MNVIYPLTAIREARTYAIGDLHGRYDLLREVIRLIETDAGDRPARLVLCGDMIDRGPQSREIIELLMAGPTEANWRWVVLMGNHEDMMLQCIARKAMSWWIREGGTQTLESYGYEDGIPLFPIRIPAEHLEWVACLPIYHVDEHRAFVHAAFDPSKSVEEQSEEFMMWHREAREHDYAFHGRHVVHGHTPYKDGPVLNLNKTNLDTKAYRTGRLPIAVFDDQVPGGPIDILWAVIEEAEDAVSKALEQAA